MADAQTSATDAIERVKIEENGEAKPDEDVVTPWEVSAGSSGKIDYDKLIVKFGCRRIDEPLVTQIENLTKRRAHPMLRRGLFFAHRDLGELLKRVASGKRFFLYTGRGPSSGSLHLGHLVPFFFTKYLQEAFDVPVVVQMTSDEKFLWKDLKMEEVSKMTTSNVKDIIAVGFDASNTFIFNNLDYMCPAFYANIVRIWKTVTQNQARSIFGTIGEDPIGKMAFPAVQAAPSFSSSFPLIFNNKKDIDCLIPCAIDQDPYFRMTRDVAPRLKYPKPALIMSSFLPALQGTATKMSSSDGNSCIYISDTPNQIKNKVNKYAFSGGQPTVEEHREKGGDPDVDISFQYLQFFLEDDDQLETIRTDYRAGRLLTGELKAIAIAEITKVVRELQERRAKLTDADVIEFARPRQLKHSF